MSIVQAIEALDRMLADHPTPVTRHCMIFDNDRPMNDPPLEAWTEEYDHAEKCGGVCTQLREVRALLVGSDV